ncbi:hypothetical protein ACHAWF_005910 [Thalassiosira exigua]
MTTKDEEDAACAKYEEGGVDSALFDAVALPDLPVDQHHLAVADAAPSPHARDRDAEAMAAAMAAAAMPDPDAFEGAVEEGGMADEYVEAAPGGFPGDGPGPAAVYHPQHEQTEGGVHPLPTPMSIAEVVPPARWMARYVSDSEVGFCVGCDASKQEEEDLDRRAISVKLTSNQRQRLANAFALLRWFRTCFDISTSYPTQEELKRYKEIHGDFHVPQSHEDGKLHAWVRTQRHQEKKLREGKPNHMSRARIDLLNGIGFQWGGEGRDKFWRDRYYELVAFHSKHGTTRIPDKYDAAPQLHTWVALQRRQLKLLSEGKPTRLNDDRIQMLKAVGLESKIRASTTWMDRFMELKRFKDEHGTCDVPQKWKENPSLGRWVDNQKTQHQKLYDGKPTHLTIERIQLLVSIGFNWRHKAAP